MDLTIPELKFLAWFVNGKTSASPMIRGLQVKLEQELDERLRENAARAARVIREPCHRCHKAVALARRGGQPRPHKCPHGVACETSITKAFRGQPRCQTCREAGREYDAR
jgi:hypothetical protein